MADLTITDLSVVSGSSQFVNASFDLGEDADDGDCVYQDSDDNKLYLTDNTDADKLDAFGMLIKGGSTGDIGVVAMEGAKVVLTLDSGTLTVGETYVLSVAGAISPIDDLTTGDYPVWVGVAESTTVLELHFFAQGAQVP